MSEPKDILDRLRDLELDLAANNVMAGDEPAYIVVKEAYEEIARIRLLNRDAKAALKFAGNMTQAVQVFFAEMIDNL